MKEIITNISLSSLPKLVSELGLRSFAADQLIQWLYQKRIPTFEDMTNLSKATRHALAERFEIDALEVVGIQKATDGTKKFLCKATDGAAVECVLIPADDGRLTVCLSTQVGCKMGCTFCRTARMGFKRDLTHGEIVGQLLLVMRDADVDVTNVVLMGMGEPMANYGAVSEAVRTICDGRAFGLSKMRVTVSTAGLIPELCEFSQEFGVKIAISLNATTDEVRSSIMPINRKYPITKIMEFCRDYSKRSRHRVTFEYVMMKGINDSEDDAHRLVELLTGVSAKVNLIPFNPFDECDYEAPDRETVTWWSEFLYTSGIQANIRVSRGQEILAACGQLATLAN